ncbi:MAG: hypothetical protein IKN53_04315, partial [Oscillibacter sp.]|nr:hypothetical protein [Oscillibacter sp.]
SDSGNDSNAGLTAGTAVASLTKAYAVLADAMSAAGKSGDDDAYGKIVVDGTITLATNNADYGDEHVYTVIVTGATASDGFSLQVQYPYNLLGPTLFENVTFRHDKDTSPQTEPAIRGDGYPVIIGAGVTTVPNTSTATTYWPSVFGGKTTAGTYDSSVSVASGDWYRIVGGTRGGAQTGDVSVTMTGGTAKFAVGASFNAASAGNITIDLSNCTVANAYGAAISDHTPSSNATLTLTNVTVTGGVYGGPGKNRNLGGNSVVTIEGGSVAGEIVMNFNNTKTGTLNLVNTSVAGPIILTNTYRSSDAGTATLNLEASSSLTLSNGAALTAATFVGGGELRLANGTTLTASAVSGSTALYVDGLSTGVGYVTTPDSATDAFFDGDDSDEYDVEGVAVGETLVWKFTAGGGEPPADLADTVYVSASGSDSNSGTDPEAPLATLTAAYAKLNEYMGSIGAVNNPAATGTIVVEGTYVLATNNASFGSEHVYGVVVTGLLPSDGFSLQVQYPYNILGPTTFENITLRHDKDTSPTTEPGIRG